MRVNFREFLKDLQATEGRTLGSVKIDNEVKPDREKLTVDVTITIKPATPGAN